MTCAGQDVSRAEPSQSTDPRRGRVPRPEPAVGLASRGADRCREPAAVTRARRDTHRLALELDRLLAAIRAGLDPVLAAGETRKVQLELAAAEATIRAWDDNPERTRPLTHDQVRGALTAAGGLVGLLKTADRTQRAKLYTELGLAIDYQREAATERIHVRSQLCGGGGTA